MTEAFTALTVLKLSDGKRRLDEPAEAHLPERRGWAYPTTDASCIRISAANPADT